MSDTVLHSKAVLSTNDGSFVLSTAYLSEDGLKPASFFLIVPVWTTMQWSSRPKL